MSELDGRECPVESLDALMRGELSADEAVTVERHVDTCTTCQAELSVLRGEQRLLAARFDEAPMPPPGVWDAIERNVTRGGQIPGARRELAPRRVVHRRWAVGAAGFALAAAASLVVYQQTRKTAAPVAASGADAGQTERAPGPGPQLPAPDAPAATGTAALDDADLELDHAIAEMQAEYLRRRSTLPPARARRYDEQFATARAAVDNAKKSVGTDVRARRQVLQARARYLRSMQAVVLREGRS